MEIYLLLIACLLLVQLSVFSAMPGRRRAGFLLALGIPWLMILGIFLFSSRYHGVTIYDMLLNTLCIVIVGVISFWLYGFLYRLELRNHEWFGRNKKIFQVIGWGLVVIYLVSYVPLSIQGRYILDISGKTRLSGSGWAIHDMGTWEPTGLILRSNNWNYPGLFYAPLIELDRWLWHPDFFDTM